MKIAAEDVQNIEDVKQLVEDLQQFAEARGDDSPLDAENLDVLRLQLEMLHQSLSMAVAQREGLEES